MDTYSQLNTTLELLVTFSRIADNTNIHPQCDAVALLEKLTPCILIKPASEIAACIQTDANLVNSVFKMMFGLTTSGSEEERAVVAKGVSLVHEFAKAGQLEYANAWLRRGLRVYSNGSEQQQFCMAKMLELRPTLTSVTMGGVPPDNIIALRSIAIGRSENLNILAHEK